MVYLNKWDREILGNITRTRDAKEKREFMRTYRELKSRGNSPEEILDRLSHGNADTRWIWYLPSAKRHIGKVA